MKNRSLLVLCIFLLNGLGCSLEPNKFRHRQRFGAIFQTKQGPGFCDAGQAITARGSERVGDDVACAAEYARCSAPGEFQRRHL